MAQQNGKYNLQLYRIAILDIGGQERERKTDDTDVEKKTVAWKQLGYVVRTLTM